MGDSDAEDSLGKRLDGGRLSYERAIRRSSLPPGARHVALTVATWANIETGVIPERFQPSLSTIAEATGLAKSSVKRHLVVLEDEGWLDRNRPDGDKARTEHARTAYRLTVPEAGPTVGLGPGWAMPEPTVGPELGPQSAKARPTVGQKSPSSPGSSSLPSQQPQKASAASKRETKAQRVIRRIGLLDRADEDAFIAWASRKFNIQHDGWWTSCADDVPGHITTWLQQREKPARARPVGVMCTCCNTTAPAACIYRSKPYCAQCTATCASCQQQHPEDQLDHGECHPCRTARSPAA